MHPWRFLLPVYGLYLLILYAYIGKILWFGKMPSGTMNWYGTLALLGYTLFYFLMGETEDMRRKSFFLYTGLSLLPITAVQLLGVYIRYEAYGLTTLRYLSMMCTAFGLASLFQGMRRKSIQGLWLLSAALILLVTVTPANAIDIPVQNQQDRLYAALDSAHMVKDGDIVEGVAEEKNGSRFGQHGSTSVRVLPYMQTEKRKSWQNRPYWPGWPKNLNQTGNGRYMQIR